MDNVAQNVMDFVTLYGLRVIGAILILIIGRIFAGVLQRLVHRTMAKANVDSTLTNFFSRMVFIIVIVFAVLAALAKFGVETTSFVAVLGAIGFAVGFAMQGSLSNFAAGIMIIVFRPFKIGDYIEAGGTAGSVQEIKLFTSVLNTPDNVKVIVPNGAVFGSTIKNYSANDTRRIDITCGIGYGSPIDKAREIMGGLVQADGRVLDDPAAQIIVTELADSSVNMTMRVWVKKEDYWPFKFEMTEKVKKAFDENDIEIPFPQRVVHHPA